jgi:hypothetical protein
MWSADVKHDATHIAEIGLFTYAHKRRLVWRSPWRAGRENGSRRDHLALIEISLYGLLARRAANVGFAGTRPSLMS